jgi:ribosomal protein S18 acetylase RimI-like enzyme
MSADAVFFTRAQKSEREELAVFLVKAFRGDFTIEQTRADVDLSFADHLFAYHFFIGREKGELVAAGALKHTGLGGNVWGIAWISVLPDRQKKGYGRRMVDFLLQHFQEKVLTSGQGTIVLSSKERNFSFYDNLKFEAANIHEGRRLYFKTVNQRANEA